MACYVDAVRSYPDAGLRFTEFCHLLADTRDELHAMADAIGMPRRFFQDHPWRWHYDLPEPLRGRRRAGRVEVTMRQVGDLLKPGARPNRCSRRFDACELQCWPAVSAGRGSCAACVPPTPTPTSPRWSTPATT